MNIVTQGQKLSGDPIGRSSTSRRSPRRSVLVGSIGSLVLGVVLSTTALPAMANVVQPSTSLASATTTIATTTTSTTPTTTTTVVHAKHTTETANSRRARVVASWNTPNSRSTSNGSPSPTTTIPTPTTVVTPTTVAPTTTTTVKAPTKAPAPSISNPSANID